MASTVRKFRRSTNEKFVAGVAGGIGTHLNVDPKLIRVAWVILAFFTIGIAALLYVILWITTPEDDEPSASQ